MKKEITELTEYAIQPREQQIKKIKHDLNVLKRECVLANVPFFATLILNYADATKETDFQRLTEGILPTLLHEQPSGISDDVIAKCAKLLNGWGVTQDPSLMSAPSDANVNFSLSDEDTENETDDTYDDEFDVDTDLFTPPPL